MNLSSSQLKKLSLGQRDLVSKPKIIEVDALPMSQQPFWGRCDRVSVHDLPHRGSVLLYYRIIVDILWVHCMYYNAVLA